MLCYTRYNHHKSLRGAPSCACPSSLSVNHLGLMWDIEEESGCEANDLDHYNVVRMLF